MIHPDDPRLTAYVLGEMPAAERGEFEKILQKSPEALQALEEIRRTAQCLTDELQREPLPGLSPQHRETIEKQISLPPPKLVPDTLPGSRWVDWGVILAMAACIILGFHLTLREKSGDTAQKNKPSSIAGAKDVRRGVDRLFHWNVVEKEPSSPPRDSAAIEKNLQLKIPHADPLPSGKINGAHAAKGSLPDTGVDMDLKNLKNALSPEIKTAPSTVKPRETAVVLAHKPVSATFGKKKTAASGVSPKKQERNANENLANSVPKTDPSDGGHDPLVENDFQTARDKPLSTLSIDADTSSCAFLARFLNQGMWPPKNVVRIGELVNRFARFHPFPKGSHPLAIRVEKGGCLWNPKHRLILVEVSGRESSAKEKPGVLVAREVMIQMEFNPAGVKAYRLIGYEKPLRQETNPSSRKETGTIPAGASLLTLYEIIPETGAARTPDLISVKVQYKQPGGDKIKKLVASPIKEGGGNFNSASEDFRFASGAAAFGQLLRDSKFKGVITFDSILQVAEQAKGEDLNRSRAAFLNLVRAAKKLAAQKGTAQDPRHPSSLP
ncbi:MAG: von Willebrand factor type A domain-containing protein [Verrucomicrobiae bacterium]|nr:von Willebrand factor type A domain-containing protein [Verrucomicrobiae bacterium]